MSAYKDAQANNDISRNVKKYKDLDLFFSKKSNKDVNKVTDVESVKRSVRNLILLNANGPLKVNINSEHIIDLKSQRFRHAFPSLIKKIIHIKPDIIWKSIFFIILNIIKFRFFIKF